MRALSLRFVDLMELGDVDAADADVAELAGLAEDFHVPYYLWATTLYAGMRALMQGRFADVEELASEGYKHGERAQRSVAVQFAGAELAVLQRELGHLDEFRALIGLAADAHSDVVPVWKAVSILANVEAGDRTRARRDSDELAANGFAAVPDDFFRSTALGLLAESCVRLGDIDRAAVLYELLLPHREQLVLLTNSVVFLGSVSYHLGVLALLRGDHDAAAQHLRDARERPRPDRCGAVPRADTALLPRGSWPHRRQPGDREQHFGPLLDGRARRRGARHAVGPCRHAERFGSPAGPRGCARRALPGPALTRYVRAANAAPHRPRLREYMALARATPPPSKPRPLAPPTRPERMTEDETTAFARTVIRGALATLLAPSLQQ